MATRPSAAGTDVPAAASDGGWFGTWSRDADDLPCFDVATPTQGTRLVAPAGDVRRIWHQVGNDRITATAHAGGWTTLYLADRMFLRLSNPDPSRGSEVGGLWTVRSPDGRSVLSPFDPETSVRARWGMGYAEWEARAAGIHLVRRVWAPFGDLPVLRIDVSIEAESDATYEESWGIVLYPLIIGGLMTPWTRAPATHKSVERLLWYGMMGASSAMRFATEQLRRLWRSRTHLQVESVRDLRAIVVRPTFRGPLRTDAREDPAWFDSHPPAFFLAALDDAAVSPRLAADPGVSLAVELPHSRQGPVSLSFAVGGLNPTPEVDQALAELLQCCSRVSREETAQSWQRSLSLQMPEAPALERESRWHAYYLRSAKVEDPYFECRYVPQGSAYGYVHGLQGAPRDYALSAVPLVFLDPEGARSVLSLMMRMTQPDGAMYYAHAGCGKCVSAVVHESPSDLPLFLLWALSEYVWASGDSTFLEEDLPFYPKARGASSTVRERVRLAFRYVREKLGTGPHGMLRVGSGDWNDPISSMAPDRRAFHRDGESGFNTALAVFALPRAADLIEESHPTEAGEMRAFAADLRSAMENAWTGRWYLRGWDGKGGALGRSHLFLDSQVWCLIARIGSEKQRRELVKAIAELCDDPSPIGATILDHPHPVRGGMLANGWDVNGGVWAAINGLLAWAYALHDPELAWRSLSKQSLAAHARAYPHVWYGIWSGPDAYNAHYADRPGETFVQPATPMAEYPVMNSNAHALPILALLRVLGIETSRDGIVINPTLARAAPWRLDTPLLTVSFDGEQISAAARPPGRSPNPPRVFVQRS